MGNVFMRREGAGGVGTLSIRKNATISVSRYIFHLHASPFMSRARAYMHAHNYSVAPYV